MKKIKMIIVLIILSTLLERIASVVLGKYYDIINEQLGLLGITLVILTCHLPVAVFIVIIFYNFLKINHQNNKILWSIFAIINYQVAIPVFLLFFLDKSQKDDRSIVSSEDV